MNDSLRRHAQPVWNQKLKAPDKVIRNQNQKWEIFRNAKAKTELSQTETAVDNFAKEMNNLEEISELKFKGMMVQVDKLRVRLTSAADLAAASGSTAKSQYKATSVGWVGVTTYTDADGNARVKSEVLVAMSGITTGNTAYPPV